MKYKITEQYRRGEKVFKGKQYRVGWSVYGSEKPGEEIWLFDLPEQKVSTTKAK